MTEGEWLTSARPLEMLQFLGQRGTERKFQLLACACCRRVEQCLPVNGGFNVLDLAEAAADGRADLTRLRGGTDAAASLSWGVHSGEADGLPRSAGMGARRCALLAVANAARCFLPEFGSPRVQVANVIEDAQEAAAEGAFSRVKAGRDWNGAMLDAKSEERQVQAALLRDIFGNLFCPITLNPSYMTPAVVSLAQTIYDDRAFDRMPKLADDLERARCTNTDILEHCRGPGPHVRGCWVIDLILEKS